MALMLTLREGEEVNTDCPSSEQTRLERMERRDAGLLRKVGDIIGDWPEAYEQGDWLDIIPIAEEEAEHNRCLMADNTLCKTTACIAGHAALQTPGVSLIVKKTPGWPEVPVPNLYKDGQQITISQVFTIAKEALGLTVQEATKLFDGDWLPADSSSPLHEAVRDALYALADGASINEVTYSY